MLARHTLYLACTRPAMKWGVPYEGWALNFYGVPYIGMALGSPFYWLLGVPIHFAMKYHANKNPNFFREVRMWVTARGAVTGGTLWAMSHRGRGGSCV